jgi:outer membrane protein assembly factor BamB
MNLTTGVRNWSLATGLMAGLLFIASEGHAENWPQWRGPENNGISHEQNLPVEWSRTENVAWELPLPGQAGSTPAIWGNRIFLTSADGNDLVLLCASTDGKQLWQHTLGTGNKLARVDEGNLASPSPSTDGKHAWAFVGSGDLACYDFSGKAVWKFNVQDRYGKFNIQFGMASTPVLDGDRLYMQIIHGDGKAETREAVVVALDKSTGKEIWKVERKSDATAENEHSYASPILYRDGQHEFLLTHGADYAIAYSLKDGAELWRTGGLNAGDRYEPTLRLVASPVAVDGLIVVPTAKNGPVLGLLPTGKGDVTQSKQIRIWTRDHNTPDVPSPLVYGGLVYLCRENGNLICLDARTGEEIYQKATHRHRHRASPVYADGRIYLTSRDGTISVVQAGREFKLLATNKLEDSIASSPAISNGRIYFRSYKALWAIGPKGKATAQK